MRRLFLSLAFLFSIGSAHAESLVVQSCGTLPKAYAPGATRNDTVDINGQKCTNDGSGTVAANQGNRGTNTQAWWTQIGDGTNGPVAVKPASTAAVATDPSLTMQLNPLSPGIITYVDPCQNPGVLKSSVAINITSATTTQLVAISGSTSIYVCHFDFTISEVVTTPNTLQFEYGTSTNCTGTNKLTGLYGDKGVTAGDPIVINAGYGGTLFTAPSANGLCALTAIGASGSFQGVLTYVQQ